MRIDLEDKEFKQILNCMENAISSWKSLVIRARRDGNMGGARSVQKVISHNEALLKKLKAEHKKLSFCDACTSYEDCRYLDGSCVEVCECGELLVSDGDDEDGEYFHCEKCPRILTITANGEKIWDCQLEPISEKDCPR
jgi:hypothetical protein